MFGLKTRGQGGGVQGKGGPRPRNCNKISGKRFQEKIEGPGRRWMGGRKAAGD